MGNTTGTFPLDRPHCTVPVVERLANMGFTTESPFDCYKEWDTIRFIPPEGWRVCKLKGVFYIVDATGKIHLASRYGGLTGQTAELIESEYKMINLEAVDSHPDGIDGAIAWLEAYELSIKLRMTGSQLLTERYKVELNERYADFLRPDYRVERPPFDWVVKSCAL